MTDIIETIERGCDNFKVVAVPKLGISVGMIILSRLTEVQMISRARQWCKKQEPPMEEPDLIKVQEDAFLLWKSLVDPDDPWVTVAEGKIPNLLFKTIEEMEGKLTGDYQDWMSEQLIQFRQDVSPLSSAKTVEALEQVIQAIRDEQEKPERFIQIFRTVYCARQGMLPTEARVREMTDDQWWLIWYSLPDIEKAALLKSPLFTKSREIHGS